MAFVSKHEWIKPEHRNTEVGDIATPSLVELAVELFCRIAEHIKDRWQTASFDEEAFAELATEVLTRELSAHSISLDEILRWVQTSRYLPTQVEYPFGDPITVFHDPRFYIDVLTWVDGTTSIHEHGFSGAFGVLVGSSLHAGYVFHPDRRYSEHLFQGRTMLTEFELLRAGDVRPIFPGARSAHSLFHLDRPSVSVVVRNHKTTSAPIQLCYLRSGIAYNPFHTDIESQRLIRTLGLMHQIDHPDTLERARALIDDRDAFTAFKICKFLSSKLSHDDYVRFLSAAPFRHAELLDSILAHAADERRESNLMNRRRAIRSDAHRYLLALLLNLRDPAHILTLVKARTPDADPVDTVMRWVAELAAEPASDAGEPNAIGIALDDLALAVMRSMIGGATNDQAIEALSLDYDGIEDTRAELTELCVAFRESVFFAPLFEPS